MRSKSRGDSLTARKSVGTHEAPPPPRGARTPDLCIIAFYAIWQQKMGYSWDFTKGFLQNWSRLTVTAAEVLFCPSTIALKACKSNRPRHAHLRKSVRRLFFYFWLYATKTRVTFYGQLKNGNYTRFKFDVQVPNLQRHYKVKGQKSSSNTSVS